MTTRRPDPADTPGPHDEFWGEQTEWTPRRPPAAQRAGLGASVGRWWDALLGGGSDAARTHGPATSTSASPNDDTGQPVDRERDRAPIGERRPERGPVADRHDPEGWTPDRWSHDVDVADDLGDEAWELEPEARPTRHPGVDPLLARLGGLAVIVTLVAPLVVGFTASGSESTASDTAVVAISAPPSDAAAVTPTEVAAVAAPTPGADTTAPAAQVGTSETAAASSPASTPPDAEADTTAPSSAVAASLQDAPESEPAATAPEVTTPPCGSRYELAAGDYWIRLADAAGVTLAELLAVNESSIDTVLVPGRSICLPVGAATPAPPATAAPVPAATTPPSRPATTPSRPATTPAPTPATTVPSRPAAVPQSQAEAIIRDIWPDDLEERALEIAWRESNHRSNVNNFCCYGLFQIHWTAHRSWLATMGVTSASQLFDPAVNANVAYALYQRSGGFGPWGG